MRGSLFPLFPLFWWPMSIHPVKTWTTKIGEIGTLSVFSLGEVPKPWEGPLFPLRMKCQNHERVPISPISPILVANVYSSCQDMDHQNKGNRDRLSVFPWWSAKTMRGSLFPLFPLRVKCQNHERVPYFPDFPYFQGLSFHLAKTWTTKIGEIGEIGTLSWFWHFTLRENMGNRDPLSVFPWWSAKTMKGPLFPLFWWPMSWQDDKAWATKIGEIGEIGTLPWFWQFNFRGNRENRDPLSVFPWWSAKAMKGSPISPILVANVLFIHMDHQNRGNRGNRDPLMVLALHP